MAVALLALPLHADARFRPVAEEVRLNPSWGNGRFDVAGEARPIMDAEHRLCILWNGFRQDESIDSEEGTLRARWFDVDLRPLTEASLANLQPYEPDTADTHPAISITEAGEVVIAWSLSGDVGSVEDDDASDAYTRRFTYPFAAAGEQIRANTFKPGYQHSPTIAGGRAGEWLVAWDHNVLLEDLDEESLRLRAFREGAAVGEEVVVGNRGITGAPAVATSKGPGYLLGWRGRDPGEPSRVFVARVSRDGVVGAPVSVSDADAPLSSPALVELPDRSVLVVWYSFAGASVEPGIYARRFAEDLTPLGVDERIWRDPDPSQRRRREPRVAASPTEPLAVVTWEVGDLNDSGGEGTDVVAQLVDGDGRPLGDLSVLHSETLWRQTNPTPLFIASDRFLATWSRRFEDDRKDRVTIQGRIFEIGSLDPLCGDADDNGFLQAPDGLAALRAAVGLAPCEPCLCDVDDSGTVTATNALAILRAAVGSATDLVCPPCEGQPLPANAAPSPSAQ